MSGFNTSYQRTLYDYQKRNSFDPDKLKQFLFSQESSDKEKELYEEIRKHPSLYSINEWSLTTDERKQLSMKNSLILRSIWLKFHDLISEPQFSLHWLTLLDYLDRNAATKFNISFRMFSESLINLGSERHKQFYRDSQKGKILGCFCMTEVGHGSNTKQIQTTAVYDKDRKEFIVHTPKFEAAKCWIGNAGKTATHTVLYAQLITEGNKRQGVHAFVVPLRNPKTFVPYPGVVTVDLGEKLGSHGNDNGVVMFNNYRIPKKNLLNKLGDVADDGKYVVNVINKNQEYALLFNVLSSVRFDIVKIACVGQIRMLVSALRYSVVMKQFDPQHPEDLPILEQQSTQVRLLPHLACAYTTVLFLKTFLREDILNSNSNTVVMEKHAISCAAKAYFASLALDSAKECLEICANLGYLSISGIGENKSICDVILTVDGDKNVLMQQTSNWLLKIWTSVVSKRHDKLPFLSLDFFNDALSILELKFVVLPLAEFIKPENISKYYQWLVCYLSKTSYEKYMKMGQREAFWAKSNTQIYHLKTLSTVFIENFVLQQMCHLIQSLDDASIKNVLNNLISLYAVWSLKNHVTFFYQGQYTDNPLFVQLIEESILLLCKNLKDDAVSLINVLAPPNEFAKFILEGSQGQIYSALMSAVMQNPKALANATWSKNFNSKL